MYPYLYKKTHVLIVRYSVFSKTVEKLVQHLHLFEFYGVPSLWTKTIGWFLYLVVGFYRLLCRLGCQRRQRATMHYPVSWFFLPNLICIVFLQLWDSKSCDTHRTGSSNMLSLTSDPMFYIAIERWRFLISCHRNKPYNFLLVLIFE